MARPDIKNEHTRMEILLRTGVDIFVLALEGSLTVVKSFNRANASKPAPTAVDDFFNTCAAVQEAQQIRDENHGSSKGGKGTRAVPLKP